MIIHLGITKNENQIYKMIIERQVSITIRFLKESKLYKMEAYLFIYSFVWTLWTTQLITKFQFKVIFLLKKESCFA